ncbi:hypothetical protein Aab01nite_38300 [Paractinoplanes abujensis]|uniref:Uncharacterized protein n=1 Tax=Paractinoplanes abujensis TaxID=882441 RepID=A0A7W7CTR9_9ACTN|nr:hypothetical protein [Actinoplanes abujensis]MBB4694546.1 hypothetical protein [Actinoplanes abujensis]GID20240.1 hypothetical protein Aab01nite_38300 [Actinoplanes abujensis]
MPDISPELFRRWYRSFEEDTDDQAVYRPGDFPFPPSRAPRPSLEFRPGGGYLEYAAGPADRAVASRGSWEATGGDGVRVRAGAGVRVLRIVAHDAQVLRIRK